MKLPRPPQIDDYIDEDPLRFLGAIKEFLARSRFWVGFGQFGMIAVMFYYTSDLVQGYFPTIWAWVVFLMFGGACAMLFEYSIVLPSQITFNAGQTSKENRNPTFREIMNLHRRLDDLAADIEAADDGTQPRADGGAVRPGCQRCDAAGVPGVHKNRPVWKCPSCENVLLREVDA